MSNFYNRSCKECGISLIYLDEDGRHALPRFTAGGRKDQVAWIEDRWNTVDGAYCQGCKDEKKKPKFMIGDEFDVRDR